MVTFWIVTFFNFRLLCLPVNYHVLHYTQTLIPRPPSSSVLVYFKWFLNTQLTTVLTRGERRFWCCYLIQHNDVRFLQDGSSDGHALLLAAAQLQTSLPDLRVVACSHTFSVTNTGRLHGPWRQEHLASPWGRSRILTWMSAAAAASSTSSRVAVMRL